MAVVGSSSTPQRFEERESNQAQFPDDDVFERMKKIDFGSVRSSHGTRSWVKSSFIRTALAATISIIFERSAVCFAANPLLAVGGAIVGCSLLWVGRKEIKKIVTDFDALPRVSKVVALGLPIVLCITAPLLIEHVFAIQLITKNYYLVTVPLVILAGLTPFLKAKDAAIDFYFWRTSRHGIKMFVDRETWRSLAYGEYITLQKEGRAKAEDELRRRAQVIDSRLQPMQVHDQS
jgi:hypothetical protein